MRFNKIRRAKGMRQANAYRNVSGISTYPYGTLVSFLHNISGVRATYTHFNTNTYNNSLFNLLFSSPATNLSVWNDALQIPYTNFIKASNQFLYNSGAYWSNEGLNWTANPGLSIGAWVRLTTNTGSHMGVFSCWDADITGRSWKLFIDGTNKSAGGQLSADGTTTAIDLRGSVELPINKWMFLCMNWIPSTSLTIKAYFDGELQEEAITTTSIPSSVYYDSTMIGRLGAYKNSSSAYDTLNGDIGAAYYSVVAISNETEDTIYQLGRKAYKV